jgi:flagellar motor protein MotB
VRRCAVATGESTAIWGLAPELVHVAGYAERCPIAGNDSEEGRARNRRVEFVFEYERGANPEQPFDLGK